MPILKVKTVSAKQVWASPDGARKIYELQMDYDGKPVKAQTFSEAIATEGWEGEVETYERGKNTFVKQPPKENGNYSGSSTSSTSSKSGGYVPKDEKAIQAMWSIGQAVQLAQGSPKVKLEELERNAQELFAMVERVKASEDAADAPSEDEQAEEPEQITIEDIQDSLGGDIVDLGDVKED